MLEMPWKAPITAERSDFTEPDPAPRWSARRRLLTIAVITAAGAAALLGVSAWRSSSVPARIYWCDRDWIRSPSLPPDHELPPDVSRSLPWTVAKKTPSGSFYLSLSSPSGCPGNIPTVGYLHHGDQYISYALSGGP